MTYNSAILNEKIEMKEMKFKGRELTVVGKCDFESVLNNAHFLLISDWEPGTVRSIQIISDRELEDLPIDWFAAADKGAAGCWIANKHGRIIAQMTHYDYVDTKGRNQNYFTVSRAKSTSLAVRTYQGI